MKLVTCPQCGTFSVARVGRPQITPRLRNIFQSYVCMKCPAATIVGIEGKEIRVASSCWKERAQ